MRSKRYRQQDGFTHTHLLRFGLGALGAGSVLFSFVWWPIQAQRSLSTLNQWEQKLSLKKSELDQLQARYTSLTSLTTLDQWATRNGPWRSPTKDDIFTIEN